MLTPGFGQLDDTTIIAGTPKQVIERLRFIMESTRPGILALWGNDGKVNHEDSMACIRLMGEEVIPAVREMGKELELFSPFEVDPTTGKPLIAEAGAPQPITDSATT